MRAIGVPADGSKIASTARESMVTWAMRPSALTAYTCLPSGLRPTLGMLQPAIERSTTFRFEVSIQVRPAGPPAISVPPPTTAPLAPCVAPAFDADLAKRAVRSIVGAPFE